MDYSELPSNSETVNGTPKEEIAPEKRKKVVTSKVKERKPSTMSRIRDSFVSEDSSSISEYLIFDLAVPAAKNMIVDMFTGGLERMFWGDSRPRSSGSRGMTINHTNYTRYSEPAKQRPREASPTARSRGRFDFRELIIASREEAVEILDDLNELIDTYEVATVADYYDMVGIDSDYTERKWGWTDTRGTEIRRVREGYILTLPRPVVL